MGFNSNLSTHNLCVHSSHEGKVCWKCSTGLLAHKGGGVAILSDNGTKFENKVLNEVYDQLGIKRLFFNAKVKNVHDFLKVTLTKFLDNSNLVWDDSFYLLVIATTYFSAAMTLNLHSSLCYEEIKQKDYYLTLTIEICIMVPMKGK